jgi:hypothetical protein
VDQRPRRGQGSRRGDYPLGVSRLTAFASLSPRSPLNDGCRTRPSRVQVLNSTSQTSLGSFQRASLASGLGTATNGEASVAMRWSFATPQRDLCNPDVRRAAPSWFPQSRPRYLTNSIFLMKALAAPLPLALSVSMEIPIPLTGGTASLPKNRRKAAASG